MVPSSEGFRSTAGCMLHLHSPTAPPHAPSPRTHASHVGVGLPVLAAREEAVVGGAALDRHHGVMPAGARLARRAARGAQRNADGRSPDLARRELNESGATVLRARASRAGQGAGAQGRRGTGLASRRTTEKPTDRANSSTPPLDASCAGHRCQGIPPARREPAQRLLLLTTFDQRRAAARGRGAGRALLAAFDLEVVAEMRLRRPDEVEEQRIRAQPREARRLPSAPAARVRLSALGRTGPRVRRVRPAGLVELRQGRVTS